MWQGVWHTAKLPSSRGYSTEPQSRASSSQASSANQQEPQALTEQEQQHLRSALLGKLQEDPKGFSDLLSQSLDNRSQRDLLHALEERPALSRQVLITSTIALSIPLIDEESALLVLGI